MIFFLGTDRAHWLGEAAVPLFVSRRVLSPRRTLPQAVAPWAADCGGFSELSLHGLWTIDDKQHAKETRRFHDEIGLMQWMPCRDWMCEPWILKKTGLSIEEHQRRTVESYEELQDLAPDLPWAPVLQGWDRTDYLRHLALYQGRGHDLFSAPVVGLGSVCRRQATGAAEDLIRELSSYGLRLHGFGFKIGAFARGAHEYLTSSDSMAWSFTARRRPPCLPGCSHSNGSHCLRYALRWRERVLALTERKRLQMELFV